MTTRKALTLALTAALFGASPGFAADTQMTEQSVSSESKHRTKAGVERHPYYVRFARGNGGKVEAAIHGQGGNVTHRLERFDTFAVMIPDAAAEALQRQAGVTLIERVPEHKLQAQVVPWNIDQFQARDIWDKNRDGNIDAGAPNGAGVKFCIIDTGFFFDIDGAGPDTGHSDFEGITASGLSQIAGEDWHFDGNGHGTHVAGTANAMNNDIGVVGVMPGGAELYIIKIFNNSGVWSPGESNLGAAAEACRDAGANVLSMSLGGGSSATEEAIFQSLYDNDNIVNIAAAGNDGNNTASYPASYESVISVAAIDVNEVAADFTQYPSSAYGIPTNTTPRTNVEWDVVELAGGGVDVLSTVPSPDGGVPVYQATANAVTYSGGHIAEAGLGTVTANLVSGGICDATNAAWNGQVVLCERGTVAFSAKVNNVRNSGGVAALLYNNVAGSFAGTCNGGCTQPSIPALSLSQAQGQALLADAVGDPTEVIADNGSGCVDCSGGYDFYSGTSMATPGVAAGVGFVWDACGGPTGITNKELRQLLRDSTKDLSGTHPGSGAAYGAGWDVATGWGLVQLADARDLGNTRFGSTCPIGLAITPSAAEVCGLDGSTSFVVTLDDQFLGSATLTDNATAPAGSSGGFSPNPIVHPVKNSTYTLSGLGNVASGVYDIEVTATDDGNAANTADGRYSMSLFAALPGTASASSPANGATGIALQPTLSWTAASESGGYQLQVSTLADFSSIAYSTTTTSTSAALPTALAANTTYYWRVRASNACGDAAWSTVASFTTIAAYCATPGTAIPDNNNTGITSTLNIPASGTLTDVDVSVAIDHTWVGDLIVTARHVASNTSIIIIDRPGRTNNGNGCAGVDIDAVLDDEALTPVESECGAGTPSISGRFTPNNALSGFDTRELSGDWTLNVRDRANGDTGSLVQWCVTPTLAVVNQTPTANAQSVSTNEDTAVGIALTGSDPESNPLTYAIVANPTKGVLSGTIPNLTYTPNLNTNGADSFTFTVNDGNSTSTAATVSITVDPLQDPPTTSGISNQTNAEGNVINLSVASSFSDPDGQSLTLSTASTLPAGISFSGGSFTGTLGFASAGSYPITVTATDGVASVDASFTWTVNNTNRAPTTTGISNQSNAEGNVINLSVASAFSDPDSDSLTLSTASTLPAGISFGGGSFSGTLSFASAGSYPITVTASDGSLSVDTNFTWTVSNTNRAPTTSGISNQSNAEGNVINLSVASAFSDPDSDSLSLSTASTLPAGISFSAGSFTGTLSFASSGSYPITVTANDSNGGTVDASFTWTVSNTNRAPTTSGISNQTHSEGELINLGVTGAFSDLDSDSLTLSTASTLPDGISFSAGAFTGTLTSASSGSYPITVTANDSNGGTVDASFTWTVNDVSGNQPPVAAPMSSLRWVVGDPKSMSLADYFTDPDGDAMTFSAIGLPASLSLDPNTGMLTGTLIMAEVGEYDVVFSASDGVNAAATIVVVMVVKEPMLFQGDFEDPAQ